MEQEEIIEGNILLAEFMGGRPEIYNITNKEYYTRLTHGKHILPEKMIYHTSWDWLMPVVEKIKKDYDFSIQFMNNECNVFVSKQTLDNDEIFSIGGYDNAKEAIWDAVVRFIKWFNQTKP